VEKEEKKNVISKKEDVNNLWKKAMKGKKELRLLSAGMFSFCSKMNL